VADRLRARFGIGRICIVADRGMISKETIEALEQDPRGWQYTILFGPKVAPCPSYTKNLTRSWKAAASRAVRVVGMYVRRRSDCRVARSSERRGPKRRSGRVRNQSCFFNFSMWACNSSQVARPLK